MASATFKPNLNASKNRAISETFEERLARQQRERQEKIRELEASQVPSFKPKISRKSQNVNSKIRQDVNPEELSPNKVETLYK